jgi:hypothetical protein
VTIPDATVIPVALWTSIDAKGSKVGREIEMKTTDDVRDSAGVILIPKGAKIMGQVTRAVPWTKKKPLSLLALRAERVEWKGGMAALNAFIAGELNIVTAAGRCPGCGQGVAVLEINPREPMGVVGGNWGLPRDPTIRVQLSDSPAIVTELISEAHTVRVEQTSTFSLRQLAPTK